MNKLKRFWKRLLCKHENYVHSYNEHFHIMTCPDCGYVHLERKVR